MATNMSNSVPLLGNCTYGTGDNFVGLKNSYFSIIHINCRSLERNHSKILHMLYSLNYSPSVIALSETWLQEDDELLLAIPNYTLISSPRKYRRGGGVAFYVLNTFVFFHKNSLTISNDTLEALTIETVLT